MKRLLAILLFCSVAANAATVSVNSPTPANTVLVGPTTGADANPTFRILVTNDFPSNVINGASIVNTSLNLTSKVTGTLPYLNGGTGGTTKQSGFNSLSPAAAKGSLIVFDGTNNVDVPVGTNNQVLVADSTQPLGIKWAAAGTGTAFSGITAGTNNSGGAFTVTGGTTISNGGSGTGHVVGDQYVATGSTTSAVDLNTAEVAGTLTNNKGGTGADTSATGGAHQFVFQTGVGSAFSVAAAAEADLPATTAFTDVANTFTSAQTINNYFALVNSSPAQITTTQTAFNPGAASFVRVNSNASQNIQGIGSGVDGRVLDIINVGSSPIVFQHQNAGATAVNRIISPSGADITLSANYGAELIYDNTDQRWRILNIYQAGGGGGLSVPNGTSGGIPYYSGTGTITGSGALSLNAIVLGGGAGGAPVTLGSNGSTTTVLHGNAGTGAPSFGSVVNSDIAANTIDVTTKLTGTLPAAQMPALTGDITNSAGSLATTLANNAVTTAKINANAVDMVTKMTGTMQAAQMPALTGDVTTIAGALATTIANSAITSVKIAANAVDMATKMTGTMLAAQMPALTGDITNSAGSLATTLTNNAVTTAKINANAVDMATKMTGTMLAAQMPALTGDVTNSAGSLATTIANLAITNAKIANSTIDLTAKVTNALPIANGGSGGTTQQTALNNIAGSAAKGSVMVNNGTNWVQLPVGTDNSVLTALASATNGVTWGAAGGATVIAPMTINAGSVQLGTCVAGTTTDANASVVIGSAGTTKKVMVLQSVATNTAPPFEVQKSDGTVQYQIDNTTNSRLDITQKVQTANQSNIQMQSLSENVTIANTATSTSAANLLPANSYIVAVTYRITGTPTGPATFSIGVTGSITLFGSGVSTVNGTTGSSMKLTTPLAPFTNSSAQQILITPISTPSVTGTLRVTVWYFTCQEPQN